MKTENSAKVGNTPLSKKILWWLIGITVVLLLLHLGLQYLNVSVYDEKHGQVYELSNRFDMDDEISLPSWFAQFTLLFAGMAALMASVVSETRAKRRLWALIGAIGIIFSIDEGSGLHEFVLQSLHLIFFGLDSPTTQLNAWWIILPLVAGLSLWLLWHIWHHLPAKTFMLLGTGGIMYLFGVVVMDLLSSEYKGITFTYQGLLTGTEETFELLGGIVVVYAITSYIEAYYRPTIAAAWHQLTAGRKS